MEMAINQRWNTRKLADEIESMLYERTTIAKQPGEQIILALQELQAKDVINPDLFFKSTYVLDFLGLKNTYSEKDLESALVGNLEQFIMELGNGFAFMERQKRISIDADKLHKAMEIAWMNELDNYQKEDWLNCDISICNKNEQLFASKYRLYLPKEEELKQLIEQDRINFELGN